MASFTALASLAEHLAVEPGRLKKRAAIAEAIVAIHQAAPEAEDPGLFTLYLAGLPFAEADPRKLNTGGALLTKAVLSVTGVSQASLTAAYRRHGDLGAAAHDLMQNLTTETPQASLPPLLLTQVAEIFAAIATARTTAIRSRLVEDLLRRATPLEAKYLLKLMLGDMRIGVKQSLVEEAIAVAAEAPVAQVRHAVMLEADLAAATRRAFHGTLTEARMHLFHPLGFMLASPVETPADAVTRFAEKLPTASPPKSRGKKTPPSEEAIPSSPPATIAAFLEDKYDGMRAQIHCGDPTQPGRVAIFSRNREDITDSYPELVEAFTSIDIPLIFDGEILAWNFNTASEASAASLEERALPFALLGQRIGRKKISNEWRKQVPIVFIAFDLLYARGELLLEQPLRSRRELLESVVEQIVSRTVSPLVLPPQNAQASIFAEDSSDPDELPRSRLILAPSHLVQSAEDIDRAYADARARANEGVMLKSIDSTYAPGRRGLAWLKLKRELASLDVVITGAEFGHGRRAGLLSDYTFAVRGPHFTETGELLNVGKAYSGVTDAEILELTSFLKTHTLEDQGHFRTVEPLIILEVAFNNIMRSGRHASGFALRFPRILRIRTDKPLAEIDTLARVEEIYLSQIDRPVEDESAETAAS